MGLIVPGFAENILEITGTQQGLFLKIRTKGILTPNFYPKNVLPS